MDKLVPQVVKSMGLAERLQQSQVFYHWPDIVGKDIAVVRGIAAELGSSLGVLDDVIDAAVTGAR